MNASNLHLSIKHFGLPGFLSSKLECHINGQYYRYLENGHAYEISLPPGKHELRFFYALFSKKYTVTLAEGSAVSVVVSMNTKFRLMQWIGPCYILVMLLSVFIRIPQQYQQWKAALSLVFLSLLLAGTAFFLISKEKMVAVDAQYSSTPNLQ